ncbi:hypothetical protein [Ktedonobacter robiniae]|uniref:hypothetical protein n=1 Tax=Ktedonobacter robiniae TaxID=2778365 RepID=UPI0019167B55|nr:hypothetical protein [Ktedonobacter robiniae]
MITALITQPSNFGGEDNENGIVSPYSTCCKGVSLLSAGATLLATLKEAANDENPGNNNGNDHDKGNGSDY